MRGSFLDILRVEHPGVDTSCLCLFRYRGSISDFSSSVKPYFPHIDFVNFASVDDRSLQVRSKVEVYRPKLNANQTKRQYLSLYLNRTKGTIKVPNVLAPAINPQVLRLAT